MHVCDCLEQKAKPFLEIDLARDYMPSVSRKHLQRDGVREKKKRVEYGAAVEPPRVNKKQSSGAKIQHADEEKEEWEESESGEGEEDEDEDDENVDGNDGIDREGMERLLKALGEDGLDDFDRAQLVALHGESEQDEDEGNEAESHGEGDEESVEDESEDERDEGEDEGGDQDEEGVALDEVESVDEDAVPRRKVEIDNKTALERIREAIKLDSVLPWTETLTVIYPQKIEVDVEDDLQRELAFYKHALHSANAARALAAKHNFPFTRPADYFAEMVKSDAHMERIRQRLLDESAGIKRSEEKRKEREGKKFGKQVQLEKLKERERTKKEMNERIKTLKRKRKDVLDQSKGGNDFDVAVEDALVDRPAKRAKSQGGAKERGRSKVSRTTRDRKYGFGGAKNRSKQNTRVSTDDFESRSGKGKKGGKPGANKRPGKFKRMAARSKR
ncbi:hypothetical protein APHAL10511_002752 [Amanita phalloides]|nr:hypothetical protein APHAL10511_002752 [Amanita phalloides]